MPNERGIVIEQLTLGAEALDLTYAEAVVRYALVGELVYVWAAPLGRTVLVDRALNLLAFEPGVLLAAALKQFRNRYDAS